MNSRKTLQTIIDEETYIKLQRLLVLESIENDTKMQTVSTWIRTLIEDTVDWEFNKLKLEGWNPKLIKKLKNKR